MTDDIRSQLSPHHVTRDDYIAIAVHAIKVAHDALDEGDTAFARILLDEALRNLQTAGAKI
jgi:hypothetical protein